MKLECALIGGTLDERVLVACNLRRRGICVWEDLKQSKKASSYRRAMTEAEGNKYIIYDLDRYGDRIYVSKPWAFRDNEMPERASYDPPKIQTRLEFFARAKRMLLAGYDRDTVADTLRVEP